MQLPTCEDNGQLHKICTHHAIELPSVSDVQAGTSHSFKLTVCKRMVMELHENV